ncbi:TonB-dependent receptor [Teredinibacter sp. KSP-S5-2]|uniref:TonB-dependent siderophore receptor n=1 Tax=Teredinibacter sp. KSP-S5-2 TaxID=3034506 RepID=UPI002934A760|nr:TonB-dependent receptor [Teredinibacter sp. KSP-S5-2]WNO10806.1 TonB-dependent receptor [Teredinibacter sp. KSP-S5-2]
MDAFLQSLVPVRAFVVLILISLNYSVQASSESRIRFFDLPAQNLQSGLIEFGLQGQVSIVADNKLLKGKRSNPIVGPHTIDSALTLLLASSSLTYQYLPDEGVYVIRRRVIDAEPDLVIAQESDSSSIDETLVLGNKYPFRYHTVTNSQMHGSVSYFDSSRFLNTIPAELFEDQQARELADVLKFASGITPGDGISNSNDDAYIRGFQRHAIYVDGFRLGDSAGGKIHPANIERIEILKGPSTLLFGQAEPGGIINVIRKGPQSNHFFHATAKRGSFGRKEFSVDWNNSLGNVADIRYRVIGASSSQNQSGGYHNIENDMLTISADWQATPDTMINMAIEHRRFRQTWDREYEVLFPHGDASDSISLSALAQQNRPEFSAEFSLIDVEFDHYLSASWHIQTSVFLHNEEREGVRTSIDTIFNKDLFFDPDELGEQFRVYIAGGQMALPLIFDSSSGATRYRIGTIKSIYDEFSSDNTGEVKIRLEGDVSFFATEHYLSLGIDAYQADREHRYIIEERDLFTGKEWTPEEFDTGFQEVLNTISSSTSRLGNLEENESQLQTQDLGFFVQDVIELSPYWLVSLGTRYSSISGEFLSHDNRTIELSNHNRFSSQVGVVFKPLENQSLYLNYSEALKANYRIDYSGDSPVKPELSDQLEFGVKSLLWNGKLLSSFALYQINKENIIDIRYVNGQRRLLSGHEEQVNGMDFDVTLSPWPSLNFIAGYAYMRPEIISGQWQGNQSPLVAEHSGSLFINYMPIKRWDMSLGVNYVGERYADAENLHPIAAYQTFDFSSRYRFSVANIDWSLDFSVKNLTDESYLNALVGGIRNNASEGRAYSLGLGVEL